jgi:hypothetical protein
VDGGGHHGGALYGFRRERVRGGDVWRIQIQEIARFIVRMEQGLDIAPQDFVRTALLGHESRTGFPRRQCDGPGENVSRIGGRIGHGCSRQPQINSRLGPGERKKPDGCLMRKSVFDLSLAPGFSPVARFNSEREPF